jgi:hypothetical protein
MSTTRNEEGGGGAAVAKRAGLQASRAGSVLRSDGCYLRLAPWHPRFGVQASHNVRMAPAYDFKLALTRVIEPTGGPAFELATLEDAARFAGLMRPWRQARAHWDFAAELLLKAAQTRNTSDPPSRV